MAKAYEGQGKLDDALAHYHTALSIRPDMAEARFTLGVLLLAQGKLDEAIAQLSEAARLRPEAAEIEAKLGVALLARGQTREALFRYREALRLKADYAEVLNNLAWVLATHPRAEFRDGAEAVTRAERACALTQRKQPLLLGTLAAAYAEAGRFTEAVEAAQNARDLARSMGQTEVAEKNDQLLQLYRQSKPYHESE
jgi:Flp pilus assembly protein TadD